MSQLVLAVIRKHGLDDANKAVYLQCFDFAETQRLRNDLDVKVKLIQLINENDSLESPTDYNVLKTPAGLQAIARVAQGIGLWIPELVDLKTMQPTGFLKQAHMAWLTSSKLT
jgi:glycerophosphoryl diester phosphodiesterase